MCNDVIRSPYLYLQDDHHMCLVDTQAGVTSGEGLFSLYISRLNSL